MAPKLGFKRSLKDRVAKHIVTRRAAPAAVASTVSATFFEHATEHTLAWPRARAFDELKQAVCAAFGHADVSLSDPETRHAIASDSQLKLLMEEWREAEAARKTDVLTTWCVKIEAQLASAESVEFGVHALWELACRPESHAVVTEALMMQLADVVEESAAAEPPALAAALRASSMAAAALWMLSEAEPTRKRMPLGPILRALVEGATAAVAAKAIELTLHHVGCISSLPNWEVEMKEGRHLHEALDKLLQLVVERTTGDVTLPITAKILNKRKDGRENAR